jgi:hypothetical protein
MRIMKYKNLIFFKERFNKRNFKPSFFGILKTNIIVMNIIWY